ncbi:proline iminopeptidase-family hydrolase [Tropicimonas isoalkanivorans]|uniref:L-proline amide hydrolase n=1 Tax=Tropicimonas isoalkanivorans TaxID=441112 RepID=A0A1I1DNV5_9RHOB|nr:proline iminopeptidase-family hydrolase [Tropicimonas isoalkanivorans]SFB74213.1 L-proline amide hydrolase [Tropicimonas isoalkanivorans]
MCAYDISTGISPYNGYETWYRICGSLESEKLPLVVVHGGPGCTHDYVDSFKALAETGRPVIHYDQIGNGKSTHLPEKGADFWTVDFFLGELDALLTHLGIKDRYAYLGQSWGGMLGAEHAVRQPAGLKALVIANSPASMELWLAGAAKLRAQLPADVQDALTKHEVAGTTDDEEYKRAEKVFNERHVCRVVPMPAEVQATFDAMEADPTVYHTMNGPNEFHVIGTMKTWSVIDRLPNITAPTLAFRGHFDEATEECVQPFLDLIPDVTGHVFPNSSHMPHVEEMDDCMAVVEAFLRKYD